MTDIEAYNTLKTRLGEEGAQTVIELIRSSAGESQRPILDRLDKLTESVSKLTEQVTKLPTQDTVETLIKNSETKMESLIKHSETKMESLIKNSETKLESLISKSEAKLESVMSKTETKIVLWVVGVVLAIFSAMVYFFLNHLTKH